MTEGGRGPWLPMTVRPFGLHVVMRHGPPGYVAPRLSGSPPAGRVYWPRPVRSCNHSICLAASAFVSRSGGAVTANLGSPCAH
jgi:hypothetical protein